MDFSVSRNYLVFPVRFDAPERRFRFFDRNGSLGDYAIRYSETRPDGVVYLDMRRVRNRPLRLECECRIQLRQVEEPTVPLLHPEREPENPYGPEYDEMPIGRPIFRADTLYVNYEFAPCPVCWIRDSRTIGQPYLRVPTRNDEPVHMIRILLEGELEAEYRVRYCEESPDFTGYLDVSRLRGKTVEIETDCQMDLMETDANAESGSYGEAWRPQVHFTVKSGWNNDPNGLILLDGEYHMFYQYGPLSLHWNNMHWGHAVSRDLVRWEELPAAICPNGRSNIASGSAVLDRRNDSGLGKEGEQPVLLFYSDTAEGWTQQIVYSTDRLKTLKRWEGNPAIPNVCASNRDPRAVFCEELDCWLLALYLDGDEYRIFKSGNLRDWEVLQTLHLPGDGECPDLYPLLSEEGERKWIFSGAHDVYLVGVMRKEGFVPEQGPERLSFGGLNYAAQTFSETYPEVRRICWQQTSDWESTASQQMGIATGMTLLRDGGRYYLAANPVGALKKLCFREEIRTDLQLREGEELNLSAGEGALLLEMTLARDGRAAISIRLFGVTVLLDFREGRLLLNGSEAPLMRREAGRFVLRLLFDRRSAELFSDGGTVYFAEEIRADYSVQGLCIRTDYPVTIERLYKASLRGIWDNGKEKSQ